MNINRRFDTLKILEILVQSNSFSHEQGKKIITLISQMREEGDRDICH